MGPRNPDMPPLGGIDPTPEHLKASEEQHFRDLASMRHIGPARGRILHDIEQIGALHAAEINHEGKVN